MATGSLDAQGIWIYGEDDSEATFSALLNKLGDSTSDVVAVLKQSGRVIQTKSVTKTDTFASTATTFTDVTGLSVSITPSSASSKILVIVNLVMGAGANVNNYARLVRNSTVIGAGGTAGSRVAGFGMIRPPDQYGAFNVSTNYLDSPATTSATTYKVQIQNNTPANIYVNRNDNDGDSANNLRGASTITVMEIA